MQVVLPSFMLIHFWLNGLDNLTRGIVSERPIHPAHFEFHQPYTCPEFDSNQFLISDALCEAFSVSLSIYLCVILCHSTSEHRPASVLCSGGKLLELLVSRKAIVFSRRQHTGQLCLMLFLISRAELCRTVTEYVPAKRPRIVTI